jgi:uncharacterized membrane protein
MKLFTLDARYVFMDHERTILNLRAAALAACVLGLAVTTLLMRRGSAKDRVFGEAENAAVPALFAHAFALLLLTLETKTFFAHYEDVAATHLSRQMTYSILYAVYATVLLTSGFVFRRLYLRVAGLVLFAGVLAKILLYDMSQLRELYRIASVLALAVLLLAGAYLYNRYQHLLLPPEVKDEEADETHDDSASETVGET